MLKFMPDEQIKEIVIKAKNYARKKGFPQLADDFSQEAFIKIASGRKTTIKNLFVDFLRQEYGDSRTKFHSERRNFNRAESIDEKRESGYALSEVIPCASRISRINKNDIGIGRDNLTAREENIINFLYEDDLKLKDIGDIYSVSESRISHIVSRIENKIKDNLIWQEKFGDYNDFCESSKFNIEWIQI